MRWQGGRGSGNIEDRRGMGPVGVGGMGVGGVVLALIGYFVFGIDPSTTSQVLGGQQAQQQAGVQGSPTDEAGRFVDVVETSNADVWGQIFQEAGGQYRPPEAIVLYDQATGTGCGMGQAAMGPFYCPADEKIYLDLSFWNELESKFGARGDFARAYVIAHEIGHHIQHQTGMTERADRMGARGAESGSVRLELQADCYAGVWARHAPAASGGAIALEPGDIEEGMGAAAAVGDDAIQRQTRGQVVPDSFTHGSSAQRTRWFQRGYETGNPNACDTFGAASL
ncbi:MAG TPA: neutral zinc metallopeptidase [Caulobacteraceae bacterium]|nr:neutral zinc metallopeptidase [Caulobacteraceae bacterium]